ncbi:MAG: TSUP family transporter [Clostridia bacterium]|nr:TSUP family transporter [Clostridia bacterium]
MEYFWYIIAALGAGIGTGLAGLSAATVMVPILIVMCPSFAGETGAYQATAIALASDILGSAVTTGVYIKHKNIDLRRGWIMLACIICMCTVGSFAAWKAGNVVLGSFTLFLTFCIGIRFLIKPDTTRKETVGKGARLDWKGVVISLFFGLTIGFGTGFVGSGGGMMMLVVFTAFLGMELKPAVGTSTFIMTFTALIASVSHILIHPAILTEKWDVMLICIVTATAASLVSAQFANRVNNRTVGLVTGVVLTILGGTMIVLNYREVIFANPLVVSTLQCFGWYLLYIVLFASALIVLHITCKVPRPLFRKLLHFPAFTSSIFVTLIAESWLPAALSLVIFAVIVYPILALLERWKGYANLFVEKHPGEIKSSLLILFLSQAAIVALSWGVFGEPWIVIAATATWGMGDTAAALIGIRYGKHPIRWKIADSHKTWEGSGAMAAVSFVTCAAAMLLFAPFDWPLCLLFALIAAPVSAFVEMISRGGMDTMTVPIALSALLWLLALVF